MVARTTLAVVVAAVLAAVAAPDSGGALHVRAVQHGGWWELRYPDGTVAANELHIPAGRSTVVDATLDGAGILWIDGHLPRVGRHASFTFTGSRQSIAIARAIHATEPRTADLQIIPDAHFDDWLAHQRSAAHVPNDASVARGEAVFLTARCTLCHTVRGVAVAEQPVAPDLTHVASRRSIAAGTVPNRTGYLAGWIADPETLKPGSGMPANNIASADFQSLLRFIESLR